MIWDNSKAEKGNVFNRQNNIIIVI